MRLNIVTFVIIAILILCTTTNSAFALSNSGGEEWEYSKEITIWENSGITLEDFQVLVELDKTNFPDNAKSDGSDLRFTLAETEEELNYFIEEYNDNALKQNAKIWVKVPKIPANQKVELKLHYGNEKASSVSDGDATFDFFDDFEGDILNESKWDYDNRGQQTMTLVSDSKLFIEGRCYKCGSDPGLIKVTTKSTFSPPLVVEFNSTFHHSNRDRGKSAWIGLCDNNKDIGRESWGDNSALFRLNQVFGSFSDLPMRSVLFTVEKDASKETEWDQSNYYRDSYNIYTITVGKDIAKLSINYDEKVSHNYNVPTAKMFGVLKVNTWQEDTNYQFYMDSYTDWFRIRKYARKEPTLIIEKTGETIINQKTASNLIDSVSTKIDTLKRKEVDVSLIEEALESARYSYESEKYVEAYALAENAKKMADDAYKTLTEYIEPAQSKIEAERSKGSDVEDAEAKLNEAKDAFNKGNYKYAQNWANDALDLAKNSSIASLSINDLNALATRYDQRIVVISGTIKDIETDYGSGYSFALDDGSGMISVVYGGVLNDIKEGDKVTVSGIFQASTRTVEANDVQKGKLGAGPGFGTIIAILGLLSVAYLLRGKKR